MTDDDIPLDAAPSVTEALARLSGDLGPIAKGDRMTGAAGNYAYRGIDALLRKASPLMSASGITFLPTVVERHVEEVAVGRDKVWRLVTLLVSYRITGPAGDSVDVTVCGEGMDGGDKAANKAMTSAYKQALVQSLAIADGHDDPDHTGTPEDAGARPARAATPGRSRPARNGSPATDHATAVNPAGDRSEAETAVRAIIGNLPADAQSSVKAAFGEQFGSGLVNLGVEHHAAALGFVEAWVAEHIVPDPVEPTPADA